MKYKICVCYSGKWSDLEWAHFRNKKEALKELSKLNRGETRSCTAPEGISKPYGLFKINAGGRDEKIA